MLTRFGSFGRGISGSSLDGAFGAMPMGLLMLGDMPPGAAGAGAGAGAGVAAAGAMPPAAAMMVDASPPPIAVLSACDRLFDIEQLPNVYRDTQTGEVVSESWKHYYKDGTGGKKSNQITMNVRLRAGHGLPPGERVEVGLDVFKENGERLDDKY